MSILVCGSMAYDHIMVFEDRFRNHILPDQIHILNVSFLVPDMRREFGGVAGNIAYNLKLLGADPLIMATLGEDADPYRRRLDNLGISRAHVREVPGTFTAQAFITTDLDDNQITAFHPGAMQHSHLNRVRDAEGVTLAIVSPDGRQGMLRHVQGLSELGTPFMFDPAQALPILSGEELRDCLERASWCAVNDYEAKLLCDKTGYRLEEIAARLDALVVTRGGQGSSIHVGGEVLEIGVATPEALVDPTGCGDAYRAGLLYGISRNWEWRKTGQLAAVMGAIKIASRGGQSHRPSRAQIAERYASAFGEQLW